MPKGGFLLISVGRPCDSPLTADGERCGRKMEMEQDTGAGRRE